MDRVDLLHMGNALKKDDLEDLFNLYNHTLCKACDHIRQSGIPVKGAIVTRLGTFQHFHMAMEELLIEVAHDLAQSTDLKVQEDLDENLDILIDNMNAMLLQIEAFYKSL